PCGDRLPLAVQRPRLAGSPPGSGPGRAEIVPPVTRAQAPGPLAPRLPGVPGQGGREDGPGRGPLLALRALASVSLGELATPGAAELPPVRITMLLVAQPKKHHL